MSKPSLLIINRTYPPEWGASGRMAQNLGEFMAAEGWKVSVLTCGKRSGIETANGVKITRLKFSGRKKIIPYTISLLKMLLTALRMDRPDIVLTLSDPPMLMVAGDIIAKKHQCQHIHWSHDVYPELFSHVGVHIPKFISRFLSQASTAAMNRAAHIVAIGDCMKDRLQAKGVMADKITVIRNWADEEISAPLNYKPPEKDLLVDTRPKFRVLYAGTLGRAHPVQTILDAAHILEKEAPDVEFVFVGEGVIYDRLLLERNKRHLHNIRLLPFQPKDRLKNLMESGDIHLISIRNDCAGLLVPCKLYSALAAARPSIFLGDDRSETAKTILHYNAGFVISQGEGRALADKILALRFDSAVWIAAHQGALATQTVFNKAISLAEWQAIFKKLRL